jgi:hypothetical protein
MDYRKIDPETVAWATENARQLLDDESELVRSLDAKAAQLAGFGGVVLAIMGSIASQGFNEDLGSAGNVVFAMAYFFAAGVLTASILWLAFYAFTPQRFVAIGAAEISEYIDDERLLRAKPWALQLRTLRALRDAVAWAQEAAVQKANRLTTGAVLFGIGLVAAVSAVVTLGLGTL